MKEAVFPNIFGIHLFDSLERCDLEKILTEIAPPKTFIQ